MGKVVSADGLTKELGTLLSRYGSEVAAEVDKNLKKTAKEVSDEIKKNAQSADFKIGDVGADYVKGWGVTKDNGKWIVYNKKMPGLAHLLEHGHRIVIHGIYTGKSTRAFEHIAPAQKLLDEKIEDLEKSLENMK